MHEHSQEEKSTAEYVGYVSGSTLEDTYQEPLEMVLQNVETYHKFELHGKVFLLHW